MPAWLIPILASVAGAGALSLFGGTKSKQSQSSTTDPFYALMSPYGIGQILQRMGALGNAGFPAGAMGNNPLLGMMGGDIWKSIGQAWPDLMKAVGTKNTVYADSLKKGTTSSGGLSGR
jgi:hypothetical protein